MAVIEVTEANFDSEILGSEIPSMVDFWAPWCGPCLVIAPVIERVAERYQGKVKVAKVNVDKNQGLAIRFSVMSIPTLLFFKDGQVVDRLIGVTHEREIEERLKKILGE